MLVKGLNTVLHEARKSIFLVTSNIISQVYLSIFCSMPPDSFISKRLKKYLRYGAICYNYAGQQAHRPSTEADLLTMSLDGRKFISVSRSSVYCGPYQAIINKIVGQSHVDIPLLAGFITQANTYPKVVSRYEYRGKSEIRTRVASAHAPLLIYDSTHEDHASHAIIVYLYDDVFAYHDCSSKSIYLVNMVKGDCTGSIPIANTPTIQCMVFAPIANVLVAACNSSTLSVWNVTTLDSYQVVLGSAHHVLNLVAVSNDPKLAAVLTLNGIVIVDISDNTSPSTRELWRLSLASFQLVATSIAISTDSRRLIVGTHNGSIQIWSIEQQKLLCEPLEGHVSAVTSLCPNADNMSILSCDADGIVRIWDVPTEYIADQTAEEQRNIYIQKEPLLSWTYQLRAQNHCLRNIHEGWVRDANYQDVLFIPKHVRHCLMTPYCISVIGPDVKPIYIDYSKVRYGITTPESHLA